MTRALLVLRRGGDVVGRCDVTCYDADHDVCKCVCGGTNHRAGFEQAAANTLAMADEWVTRARARGEQVDTFDRGLDALHEPLFTTTEVVR